MWSEIAFVFSLTSHEILGEIDGEDKKRSIAEKVPFEKLWRVGVHC